MIGLTLLLGLLTFSTPVQTSQPVVGPILVVWDQEPVAGVSVLPSAFTYELEIDGAVPVATAATCTAPTAPATDWTCKTTKPLDLAAGNHTIAVIAKATISGTNYVSAISEPLIVVRMTITIGVPKNVRVEPAPPGGE